MKGNMLILAPLCLLLLWMLPVDSMGNIFIKLQNMEQVIPLNMAEDSVDDMYFGCSKQMMKKVKQYKIKNMSKDKEFADAWKKAKKCASKKKIRDKGLTREHLKAICAFTSNDIYQTFNDAVRNDGKNYLSSFNFQALHFLLTSAIQILNDNQPCLTAYRRTKLRFEGQVNQRIRFGSFASSSRKTGLTDFGHETCFQIKTCSGAPLKHYSVYESEQEILIPPYEVFVITEKIEHQSISSSYPHEELLILPNEMFKIPKKIQGKNKIDGLSDCKLIYILESAGAKSTLNCKDVRT
ncbi:NAD(P)(+)--arginine ADP-ribosyltransferase 2-like [Mastacembelus armatus]|uniref:NAD(P)(+)--arginine ADP-ribosyltransferase n=1 Tax=Mastacembelus armatus TaxID=205130 RepID=A0A3Q3MLB7_9TELE|nr:NAD(P)(+)--arginine ADP-ribosyltransferase 2-like [Mastacembelus armatus]